MKVCAFLVMIALVRWIDGLGIDTVSSLNVTKYLGRWYQIYADAVVTSTFERDAVCVTADYTLRKDEKIGVLNSERLKTPKGKGKNITGYAYVPDPKYPGKLKVHLDGVPIDAQYWVVKLGPPSFSDQHLYQYSVITDGFQVTLFVLARDVNTFKSRYDEEVKEWLKENGFSHVYNKPIATLQSDECIYS
ncbi:PREDICTED: outer membrane lipoprotein Blc-like [Acropora digitifera]|uniref:outer membrane lipoprotein Blc-like n=1 Tax=Acropora digitifera TaxID=70779 RepID=UPI00077A322D|nr:PREDICTED: outer membrane lipoprotein Blc-like [Acropora digitifera]